MENYLLLIVGILSSVIGAVNIKGNIRTIHAPPFKIQMLNSIFI